MIRYDCVKDNVNEDMDVHEDKHVHEDTDGHEDKFEVKDKDEGASTMPCIDVASDEELPQMVLESF